jgi:UDP-N-acetylmuramyl pentapeptide synthase
MPASTYHASDVDFEANTFVFHDKHGETVTLPFAAGNLFNVFNVTAAAAVCRMAGVSLELIGSSVSDLSAKTGRFQAVQAGTRKVVSMLFKNQNPISGSQSLNYLRNIKGEKDVVLVVTDSKDKVHGHEDISWLYDTDFDTLRSDEVKHVLIGGTRCYDVALRLVLAGVDEQKLLLYPEYDELAKDICDKTGNYSTVVIYFELYAVPVVEQLKKALLGRTDG